MEQLPIVSPMVAAYLAADRIANPGGALNSIHAPCVDAKVNMADLCAKIFAVTFLRFRDDGLIKIELIEKKVLFVRTQHIVLHKQSETSGFQGGAAGLFGSIGEGGSAGDAVRRWYGADYARPYLFILQTAREEALGAGFVTAEATQGLGEKVGAMLTGARVAPEPGKAAEIAAIVDSLAERWQRFIAEEPQLESALVKECNGAIKSRTEVAPDATDFTPVD